jgi:hypothetical protein
MNDLEIKGYDGDYKINENGDVFSYKFEKVVKIKPSYTNTGGYPQVSLRKDGITKAWTIPRLLLTTFKPTQEENMVVLHINDNPLDNRLENLRWGTQKENMQMKKLNGTSNDGERCWKAKLTNQDVIEICALLSAGQKQKVLAKQYGLSAGSISNIRTGKSWSSVTGIYYSKEDKNNGK